MWVLALFGAIGFIAVLITVILFRNVMAAPVLIKLMQKKMNARFRYYILIPSLGGLSGFFCTICHFRHDLFFAFFPCGWAVARKGVGGEGNR